MTQLPYEIFDADNHYYEAEDAFTRHMDRKLRRRCMDWALVNGRKELLVAGAVNRFIPNPTFNPVARPGCLDDYYQGKNKGGLSIKDAFGALEPIHVEYRDRDARVKVMKQQRLEGALFFPTLGVGMEEALSADPPAVVAAFNAFNEWLHEDWGYAYKNVIFAAPYISLMDLDNAVAQLERALARDVRVIVMRPAPVRLPGVSRSPADPHYDRFWARVNESGITVAMHGGDSGYGRYFADWGEGGDVESFKGSAWKGVIGGSRAPFDAMAALVCHGLFQRFPRIRVCSIEMGANWVPWLIQSFKRAYGISPQDFAEDPVETFKRHVWISPFHEDDVAQLRDLIGADRLLMGSDWPHAEGLANPTDFIRELKAFSPAEQRLVMHDNAAGLVRRA